MVNTTENTVLTNGIVWAYRDGNYTPLSGFNVFINGNSGKIDKVSVDGNFSNYRKIDAQGYHLVPGAIDTHCHGISNQSVGNITEGIWDIPQERFDSTKAAIIQVYSDSSILMAQHGTTSWIPTTIATSEDKLKASLEAMLQYISGSQNGAEIVGVGIEGSFLYPDEAYVGCLNKDYFFEPTLNNYKKLIENIAGDYVKWVGVDPRWAKALRLTQHLAERNILLGIGHSGASEQQVIDVFNKISEVGTGGMLYIHLYNGPNGSNNKPGYSLVQQAVVPTILLSRDHNVKLHAQLILDSVHHDKRYSLEGLMNFGKLGIVAVTDNIGVGPNSKVKRFTMAEKVAYISQKNHLAIWRKEPNSLFGSRATTIDHMLPYILRMLDGYPLYTANSPLPVFDHQLSLPERMDIALHLLSKSPANIYGLANRKAILDSSYDADIVVVDIDRNENVAVKKVFVHGKEIEL